jgi:hypothetical protein
VIDGCREHTVERPREQRTAREGDERLRPAEAQPDAVAGSDDDDRGQEASTSSSTLEACSSSVFSASASSEIRI